MTVSYQPSKTVEVAMTFGKDQFDQLGLYNLVLGKTDANVNPNLRTPSGVRPFGYVHTHPDDGGEVNIPFSGDDIAYLINSGLQVGVAVSGQMQFLISRTSITPSSVDNATVVSEFNRLLYDNLNCGDSRYVATQKAVIQFTNKYGLSYYQGTVGNLAKVHNY
jgi:hypothetical protein